MRRSQIEIRAVAGGIGAEIGNVDINQDSIKGRSAKFARPCSIIA